jgi:hypothetical protein
MIKDKNIGHVFGRTKLFVIVITALMTVGSFSAFNLLSDNARAADPIPTEYGLYPVSIAEGNSLTYVYQNYTNVAGALSDPRIYMNPTDIGCSGAWAPSGLYTMLATTVANQTFMMPFNPFFPHLHPGYSGPGFYNIYMELQDNGVPSCGLQMILEVTGPDVNPPYVAGHSGLPPVELAGPPEANNTNPSFSADPVVFGDAPTLRVTIDDSKTGGSNISAGEFFVCESAWPVRCTPPGMTPGTGAPLQLYGDNPWIPGPGGQNWDEQLFVYTETQVNTGMLPGSGTYWFWIHGNDLLGNWGDFANASQEFTRWYVLSLNVTSAGNNAPVLSWTNIPGPFFDDGLDPHTGDTTTLFEYMVNYTDADDQAPTAMNLFIERPCGSDFLGPLAMTFYRWADSVAQNYTTGAIYNYSHTFAAGDMYGYRFEAHDGFDPAMGGAPLGCTPGPDVSGGPGIPPPAPANLWVERSDPDIIVHWDASARADEYNVYIATNDRFAAFPWPVSTELTTSFTHTGAYDDANTYFYIVRAYNTTNALESTNSTMGVKLNKTFGTPYSPMRNMYWMSLPYISMYKKAKDITEELTSANINAVCKWIPANQNSICYTYWAGMWRGQNFDITMGDAIMVNSVNPNWYWVINGTDMSRQLSFTVYPMGDINWISLPYTNSYMTASDIVYAIEGPAMQSTNITAVALWVPATQAVRLYYWDGGGWTGDNFDVMPGDGHYLEIVSGFQWTPDLITPTVP